MTASDDIDPIALISMFISTVVGLFENKIHIHILKSGANLRILCSILPPPVLNFIKIIKLHFNFVYSLHFAANIVQLFAL